MKIKALLLGQIKGLSKKVIFWVINKIFIVELPDIKFKNLMDDND